MNITIIGCGVMGSAFAEHFAANGHQVVLNDRNPQKTKVLAKKIQAHYELNAADAVSGADLVILAIKPKDLLSVVQSITTSLGKNTKIISVLAGTCLNVLKQYFPHQIVVRAMPNLALSCQEGVVGMVDDSSLALPVKEEINLLLNGMGLLIWLSESKLEGLASLAASGIGFVFLLMEAMVEGGIYMGLSSTESTEIVLKTMEGSVALVRKTGKHPAELKLEIASPGGMTIAGLKEMEDRGVRSGVINGLIAAYKKANQLLEG